ncbi:MAG: glycosyltransferase family 4 protein [Planctomycetota bacterium]
MKSNVRTNTILITGLARLWSGVISPSRELVRRGFNVVLFYFEKNKEFTADTGNISVIKASSVSIVNLAKFLYLLIRYRPRHVEVYFHTGKWIVLIAQVLVSRLIGVPVVSICTGNEILNYPHPRCVFNLAIRVVFQMSRAIVVKELYMRDTIIKYGLAKDDKIHFMSNKIAIGTDPGYVRFDKVILYLNLFKKYRRIDLIVKSASLIREEFPDARFLLVGAGRYTTYEHEMAELAKSLKVDDVVSFLPYTSDPKAYFEKATIFVLPADIVYCNNALLEAMERGVVPVVADVQGAELIVEDGVSGLRVPQNAVEIANAIKRLLADESLRLRLAQGARNKIKAEFDEQIRVDFLGNLYSCKVWK